MYLVRALTWL